jgi:hypothetical protein
MPVEFHKSKIYRVEFWDETVKVLDRLRGVFPQFRTLDPFVSRLLQEGAEGEVVLIDDETDEVVARQKVARSRNCRAQVW